MRNIKLRNIHFIYLFVNIILYNITIPASIWVLDVFVYFGFLLFTFYFTLKIKFPLAEVVTITIFVQNVFAISILYLYISSGNYVNPFFYTKVPIEEYLPFVFLAVQGLYVGYLCIKMPTPIWRSFYINMPNLIKTDSLVILIILGFIGTFILSLRITSLSYIGFILNSFFQCAFMGFIFLGGKSNRVFIIVGFVLVFTQLLSGMFGSSFIIFEFAIISYLVIFSIKGKKINWYIVSLFSLLGIVILAFLQNIKSEYRDATWTGNQSASTETFLNIAESNAKETNSTPFEFSYYLALLSRLNQGAIVSETVYVVPKNVEFQNGKTIYSAVIDAFVPRFLNPGKEMAGGREKIPKYATRRLIGSTSMNIGLIGEGYINFGKSGCILFFIIYGLFVALFERYILKIALKTPMILVLFPIYFAILNGSEGDFMMLFNGLLKSTIFIILILEFISSRVSKKSISIVN